MSLRILRIAAGSTFQDRGRPGWRRFGVPPGGAFDREAHLLALALVGKGEGATLEIPALGGSFEATEPDYLAVTGAHCRVLLNGKDLTSNSSFPVGKGDFLAIMPAERGLRVYLASRRGFVVDARLNSASGIEPEGEFFPSQSVDSITGTLRKLGSRPDSLLTRKIRFVPGPHARLQDLEALSSEMFRVSLASNRVGTRLEGGLFEPMPELPSEPSCVGSVQLAPSGELLIHGPDGPTIGGYPKIAVVIRADHNRLGQIRPADEVEFEQVNLEQARLAFATDTERIQKWVREIRIAG